MIDGSIVRSHQHAAGAQGGQAHQALGRSRGGLSTKIHAKVDAFGLPLGFIITGGQEHEIKVAKNLLNQEKSDYLLADRAYDSNEFRDELSARGTVAVIPARKIEFITLSMMFIFIKKEITLSVFSIELKGSDALLRDLIKQLRCF
ncbi:IS5/IS1182 family transposase [Legionella pneumophila]|uniref:IS5/IS1182 family transposase n=1 Tax=Legionella pneumophila TaxID=446 RepID=UPI0004830A29|nr:transposase [Legionella pneumophila]